MKLEEIIPKDFVKVFKTGEIRRVVAVDVNGGLYYLEGLVNQKPLKRDDIEKVYDVYKDELSNYISIQLAKVQLEHAINVSIDKEDVESFNVFSSEYKKIIKALDNR